MDKRFIVLAVLTALFCFWLYWAIRMKNYWNFELSVGKKGSGKTLDLTKKALWYNKHKFLFYDDIEKKFKRLKLKIYSNSDIKGIDYETYDIKKLGISWFPEEYSILFIDEIAIYYSNRSFKTMDPKTIEFFRQLRKYKCKVVGYSQGFDIDKVLRQQLCDRMYLIQRFLFIWSIKRKIDKFPTIKESAIDCDSQLVDSIKFSPWWLLGSIKFTYMPKWIKYFDTYQIYHKE